MASLAGGGVADLIRAGIAEGTMADRLPAEGDLAERCGVKPATPFGAAIAALAADGLVLGRAGTRDLRARGRAAPRLCDG